MHIDRAHADRYLAFLGIAQSFLYLIVAFAFTVTSETNEAPVPTVTVTK